MALKLLLVDDGEVLCEVPLSLDASMERELQELMEEGLSLLNALASSFSHARRLQILAEFLKGGFDELEFSELTSRLGLNPKQIWEHVKALERSGVIERRGWGRYAVSRLGATAVLMVGLSLHRMLRVLEGRFP
ncbi:MAG: hypothetical protein DRJ98_05665 [Thermoprotei archaeon]|nr:MAG: hypothetical protein DRJ98_05665 [Thermoprotei archaeon]